MTPEKQERPIPIRVMVVTNDPELADSIRLHLVQAFPIVIARVVDSAEQCRSLIRGIYPDVVLIAEGTARRSLDVPALALSREINLTYPGIATIVLAHDPSQEYLMSAFEAGARGVVAISASEQGYFVLGEDLEPRIRQAYEFVARQFPQRLRGPVWGNLGRIVVVFSPKGGVGKSLIASTLAAHLAVNKHDQPPRRVVLVDLNLQFGSLDVLLDMRSEHTITDVARVASGITRYSLEGLLPEKELSQGARLYVLPAPATPSAADQISADQIGNILTSLRNQFEFTVVDTTSVISDVTLTALQMASDILLVCTPDLLSIHQCRAAIEFLAQSESHVTGSISMVLNRVSQRLDVRTEDLRGLFEYPILAEIPSDYAYLEPVLNSGQIVGMAAGADNRHGLPLAFGQLVDQLTRSPDAENPQAKNERSRRSILTLRKKKP